jgi:bifunctional ADP-heptose synthase (sugar kinase/adenylyltransferase)
LFDPNRPTTNKDVIVAAGHHLLKVDRVDNRPIPERIVRMLVEHISAVPADIVVFSDFRHGIFNRETIPHLVAAIPQGAFRVADTQVASRWGNILDFQGFDLITPNEREARFALGDQDSVVRPLGAELYRQARCKTLLLKLGSRGLMTFRAEPRSDEDVRSFFVVDSFAENVVDAIGSGDALLAYAAPTMYLTNNAVAASILGSLSAAVACSHQGNVPTEPNDILARIDRLERLAHYR